MDPHLLAAHLDSFAARSVDKSLADFTRDRMMPPSRPRRSRQRGRAAMLGTTLTLAAPAVTAVVVLVVR